jgi:hypothetical protein
MCIFYMLRKMAPPKTTTPKIAKWEDAHVDFMLDLYVEKYLHTECGNLGAHHWQYIVDTFNKEFSKTWTVANIKTKVDWLHKTYKTQWVNVVKPTGRTPFTWRWYEICDKIWGCTPKVAWIPGAKENGEDVFYTGMALNLDDYDGRGVIYLNSECTMFSPIRPTSDEDGETIGATTGINGTTGTNVVAEEVNDSTVESELEKVCKMENINGQVNQRGKKRKVVLKEEGDLAAPMAKAMEKFVDTYKAMEEMKIKLATNHLELVATLPRDRNNVELRLHEAAMEMEKSKMERAEELKLRILEMQLRFGQGGSSSFTNGQE